MNDGLRDILSSDARIAYALVFGSVARGRAGLESDLDIAIGLLPEAHLSPGEIGGLVSKLETEALQPVDLVIVGEAPVPLAYRIFRDGILLFERDHVRQSRDRAAAILGYLDFRPVEERCARGVLAAAADGR